MASTIVSCFQLKFRRREVSVGHCKLLHQRPDPVVSVWWRVVVGYHPLGYGAPHHAWLAYRIIYQSLLRDIVTIIRGIICISNRGEMFTVLIPFAITVEPDAEWVNCLVWGRTDMSWCVRKSTPIIHCSTSAMVNIKGRARSNPRSI